MSSMNLKFDAAVKGTKISDVKVDPRLRVRDDTGMTFLNLILSGDSGKQGFTPGTVHLFTGTSGGGKTTLALQLASSLASKGHVVLYNTGEESLAQVKMTVERLRLEGDFYIGADVFVDRPPAKCDAKLVKQTLRENITFLRKKLDAANKKFAAQDFEKQRRLYIIVDSLQCMNDGKYGFGVNTKTPIRVLEELTQLAKQYYVTMIVIGHVGKAGEFAGNNTIKHIVDGHIHLYIDLDEKSDTAGLRIIEMRKNRFGPSGIAVPLTIGPRGLKEAPGFSTRGARY